MATRKRLKPSEREGAFNPIPQSALPDLWSVSKEAAVLNALYGAALESESDLVEASLPVDHMAEIFGLDPDTDRSKVNQAIKRLTQRGLIQRVSGGHRGAAAVYRLARPWPKKKQHQ